MQNNLVEERCTLKERLTTSQNEAIYQASKHQACDIFVHHGVRNMKGLTNAGKVGVCCIHETLEVHCAMLPLTHIHGSTDSLYATSGKRSRGVPNNTQYIACIVHRVA